ncbi:hypothetical protein LINPERHAP2_LOCUS35837 [Linum perenne]
MHIQRMMNSYAKITGHVINSHKLAIMFSRHTLQAL